MRRVIEVTNGSIAVEDRPFFYEAVKGRTGLYEVRIEKVKKHRSEQQNKYYWGTVIKVFSAYVGVTPDECHTFMRAKFKREQLSNGFWKIKSTTDMCTKEFTEYIDNIRLHAMENYKLNIPLHDKKT